MDYNTSDVSKERALTVGELRAALAGVPDDVPVVLSDPTGMVLQVAKAAVPLWVMHDKRKALGGEPAPVHLDGPYGEGVARTEAAYPSNGRACSPALVVSTWSETWTRRRADGRVG